MTHEERKAFNKEFADRWRIYDGVLWRLYETCQDGQDVQCAAPCGDVTTIDDALSLTAETLHNIGE